MKTINTRQNNLISTIALIMVTILVNCLSGEESLEPRNLETMGQELTSVSGKSGGADVGAPEGITLKFSTDPSDEDYFGKKILKRAESVIGERDCSKFTEFDYHDGECEKAWCSEFVIWAYSMEGYKVHTWWDETKKRAKNTTTANLARWFMANRMWLTYEKGVRPNVGDFVYFRWEKKKDRFHAAIVKRVEEKDYGFKLITIEGNVTGTVNAPAVREKWTEVKNSGEIQKREGDNNNFGWVVGFGRFYANMDGYISDLNIQPENDKNVLKTAQFKVEINEDAPKLVTYDEVWNHENYYDWCYETQICPEKGTYISTEYLKYLIRLSAEQSQEVNINFKDQRTKLQNEEPISVTINKIIGDFSEYGKIEGKIIDTKLSDRSIDWNTDELPKIGSFKIRGVNSPSMTSSTNKVTCEDGSRQYIKSRLIKSLSVEHSVHHGCVKDPVVKVYAGRRCCGKSEAFLKTVTLTGLFCDPASSTLMGKLFKSTATVEKSMTYIEGGSNYIRAELKWSDKTFSQYFNLGDDEHCK